jgi:large subunit ribosomal protein L17
VLNKLFGSIAERFKTRPGGYTRLVRVGRRAGDNAELAVIELVDRAPAAPAEGEAKGEKKAEKKAEPKAEKAAKAKAPKAPKAEKKPKAEKADKPEKKAKK